MVHGIVIHEFGGPEVLKYEEIDVGAPGPGQVRLRQTAVSLNFADIQMRLGAYYVMKLELPAIPGVDGVGIVEELGAGVTDLKPGQHVAYAGVIGAYAGERLIPADRLVVIPEGLDDVNVAAAFLKGLTVQYLVTQSYPIRAGETVLIHSAAGGVGVLLCQWAKHLGAKIIGTVGSDAKIEVAKQSGCDHVINYSTGNFAKEVLELTDGVGVPVVYDAVGRATFAGNIESLAIRGHLINYGHASGALEPIDAAQINSKSLFFNKSSLVHYMRTREDIERMTGDLFGVLQQGVLKPSVNTYALSEAAKAQQDMADRTTTGSTVLVP